VVATGPFRTGKSFLLNHLLDRGQKVCADKLASGTGQWQGVLPQEPQTTEGHDHGGAASGRTRQVAQLQEPEGCQDLMLLSLLARVVRVTESTGWNLNWVLVAVGKVI
jgi:hypothetical protein